MYSNRLDQPLVLPLGGTAPGPFGHPDRLNSAPRLATPMGGAATVVSPTGVENRPPKWVKVLEFFKWLGYNGIFYPITPYDRAE